MKKLNRRGQAVVELALGSLLLVAMLIMGIYFGEVTFGALKVTEATNSAMLDLTHYKVHNMPLLGLYSTGRIGNAVTQAQADTLRDYANFDGRTSQVGVKIKPLTQLMTEATPMLVRCNRGGGPGYMPNPLVGAAYDDNSGASCSTEADFVGRSGFMPTRFSERSGQGFFQAQFWPRAALKTCGMGKAIGGSCQGRATIMLDDWGLTGPGGGEWLPAPGLPFGIPSFTNPSYWGTTYKLYLSSYWFNALMNPTMWSLPASQMALAVTNGIHPMGLVFFLQFGGIPWNESTFYMSYNSSLTLFQEILIPPQQSENGIAGSIWETTPFLAALPMISYFNSFNIRRSNGGCYLGFQC